MLTRWRIARQWRRPTFRRLGPWPMDWEQWGMTAPLYDLRITFGVFEMRCLAKETTR